jgi:hypothetical protein
VAVQFSGSCESNCFERGSLDFFSVYILSSMCKPSEKLEKLEIFKIEKSDEFGFFSLVFQSRFQNISRTQKNLFSFEKTSIR